MTSNFVALNILRPGVGVVSGGGSTTKRKTAESVYEQDEIVWPEDYKDSPEEEAILIAVGLLVADCEI